jgi:hypothetical protein
MFSTYPYWDVSYLVAVVFTLGSLVWCINAFFVWLPLQDPSTEFNDEITSAGGITAFIGATIFEFGSILLMIEAVNENRADCFGWALEEVLEERGVMRLKPDGCVHHHRNKGNLVGKGKASEGEHLFMFNDPFLAKALLEIPKNFRLVNKKRELSLRVLSLAKLIGKNEFCKIGFANIPSFNRRNSKRYLKDFNDLPPLRFIIHTLLTARQYSSRIFSAPNSGTDWEPRQATARWIANGIERPAKL